MTKYFERVANSEKSVVRTSLCENSEKSVFWTSFVQIRRKVYFRTTFAKFQKKCFCANSEKSFSNKFCANSEKSVFRTNFAQIRRKVFSNFLRRFGEKVFFEQLFPRLTSGTRTLCIKVWKMCRSSIRFLSIQCDQIGFRYLVYICRHFDAFLC
jgi:hypothetical protein